MSILMIFVRISYISIVEVLNCYIDVLKAHDYVVSIKVEEI